MTAESKKSGWRNVFRRGEATNESMDGVDEISMREQYEKYREDFEALRLQLLHLIESHNADNNLRSLRLIDHFGEFYNDEQSIVEYTGHWADDRNSHAPLGFHYDLRNGEFMEYNGSVLTSDFKKACDLFEQRLMAIPKKDESV